MGRKANGLKAEGLPLCLLLRVWTDKWHLKNSNILSYILYLYANLSGANQIRNNALYFKLFQLLVNKSMIHEITPVTDNGHGTNWAKNECAQQVIIFENSKNRRMYGNVMRWFWLCDLGPYIPVLISKSLTCQRTLIKIIILALHGCAQSATLGIVLIASRVTRL